MSKVTEALAVRNMPIGTPGRSAALNTLVDAMTPDEFDTFQTTIREEVASNGH